MAGLVEQLPSRKPGPGHWHARLLLCCLVCGPSLGNAERDQMAPAVGELFVWFVPFAMRVGGLSG